MNSATLRPPLATDRPLLSIPRKDLDNGPKDVRAPLPKAWLVTKFAEVAVEGDAVLGASSDGRVDLHLVPAGDDNFLLRGHVHAAVDTTCGRCLGPATIPVDGEITLLLVPKIVETTRAPRGKKAKESEGELEFDPDEADVASYDGETVILDDLVREAILLEMPISPLCSEECAGMRLDPAVAARLAEAKIDPRLAPLAKLAISSEKKP